MSNNREGEALLPPELVAQIDAYGEACYQESVEPWRLRAELVAGILAFQQKAGDMAMKDASAAGDGAKHWDTPSDWAEPKWSEAGRVHEWKNYVSEEVQAMWGTFTDAQKAALARSADEAASREDWE